MNSKSTHSNLPLLLSIFVLTFIFWITIAPSQLGGFVTYVLIRGNSMEPGFRAGDLVLVREAPVYMEGDAIVYHNAEMGSLVFHRVVGMELDRYVLKGDNNSWLDSYLPAQNEIVGKLWMRIPKLGTVVEWVRIPLHLAILVSILGGVVVFDLFQKPSPQKKGNRPSFQPAGLAAETALYISAALVVCFLAAGVYAFTRPLNRPAENIPYQQDGHYYYSATGTPGVYDTDTVRSGEPVFPKLTCFLNIGYTYNFSGNGVQSIGGTQKMYARIMDEQSGWFRTIPLNSETVFTGTSYFTLATLDLCQVEALVNIVEQEAGLYQLVYRLEIIADTTVTADMKGNVITDSFSPALVFRYDKVHFYLAENKPGTNPLRASKAGLAGNATSLPNTISIFGAALPVWIARFFSLLGFSASLIGAVYSGVKVYRTASQSPDALIRLKYGSLLMDVAEQTPMPSGGVVDIASMDDLARLADRHGTMILHMQRNFLHYYFVQSNGATYRYVISTGRADVTQSQPSAPVPVIPVEVEAQIESAQEPIPLPPQWQALLQMDAGATIKADFADMEVTQPTPIQITQPTPVRNSRRDSLPQQEYRISTGAIQYDNPQEGEIVIRKINL